jgi:hypothetical protein
MIGKLSLANRTIGGGEAQTRRPRWPDKNVLRAFGSLLSNLAEPLGNPGAALTGLLLNGKSFSEEVSERVAEFDQAVADQEFWRDI